MKRCPIENTWHPNEYRYCPDCGLELERNEVSSEDGDDGVFADCIKCAWCGISLTSTTKAFDTNANKKTELLCNACFDKFIDEVIAANRLARKRRAQGLGGGK